MDNGIFTNNISNEAYVPTEIEQINRVDIYNEMIGMITPHQQQEEYNQNRNENIEFGKKMQDIYDKKEYIIQQKEEKKHKQQEKKNKIFNEKLEQEKQRILNRTQDINNTIDRKFVKFITERYTPEKKKKHKYKQEVFDEEIKVKEEYCKKSRDLKDFDWKKIKENQFYEYQIANYFNKETIVFHPDEIWIPLYDIPDIYMISNYGRLYNKNLKYLIRPIFIEYTALYFIYYPGTTPRYERRKSESIGKMVLQSFCPVDEPEKHTVIYIDGDKRHFHLSNLKWRTKNDKIITMKQVAPEWMNNFSKCNGRQTKYIL